MKVSSTKVDIAPSGVFYLDGYLNDIRQLPGAGIHDEPYAILLLLEESGQRALFVGIDVCQVSLSRTRKMRSLLSSLLGIRDEFIVISAVHSHSCPNGLRDGSSISHDTPGYEELVTGLVVQAASRLPEMLAEAKPEILATRIRGWYSNRNDKDKPFDDQAFIVRFVADDGSTVGAMQNFNCHSTVVGPFNRLITSDLQGSVRALLAPWVGITPYAFTGASGDLGNRQFRRGDGFAELQRTAVGISAEFMKGSFEPVELGVPTVREFTHNVDYDNGQYFTRYQELLEKAKQTLADDSSTATKKKLARTEVHRLSEKLEIDRVQFPIVIRVIDFGGLVFVTFPGELGSVLGMRIKSMFHSRRCLVIGYANDAQGYFVPSEDFGRGYESFVTKLPRGGIESVLDEFEEWL
jgi:hypothetical protein